MVIIHGFFLSSSTTLLVVAGTLSEGLLQTFFCVFYGYYSWFFSQSFNNFAGSGWDFEQRTSSELFLHAPWGVFMGFFLVYQ